MKIITGFEPSRIVERDSNRLVDVLETTQHDTRYPEDLKLLREVGIDTLRVAVPWHRIEREEGVFTWKWMDNYMHKVRELGITPIMDTLHHTSFPMWMDGGFIYPRFRTLFTKFFELLIKRYHWVKDWTIVNEPFVTILFCTNGIWYPFQNDDRMFHHLTDEVADIITYLSERLRERGMNHIYIDACEVHRAVDEQSQYHAAERNQARFIMLDKLTDRNCSIQTLGVDYYAHSEFEWSVNGREPTKNPIGFAETAHQYYQRYQIPLMLTETNIRGYISDRTTWFVHMYKQCQKLSKFVPFEGMCWYPFIDCTDWDSLITQANKNIDPQGIIWLDNDFERHTSEFSDNLSLLIRGEISIDQFPTYDYKPPLDYHLQGFVNIGG